MQIVRHYIKIGTLRVQIPLSSFQVKGPNLTTKLKVILGSKSNKNRVINILQVKKSFRR